MRGLMQDWPLRVPTILDHAALYHGSREVVTRSVEGPIHRYSYADLQRRARRCASALVGLGVRAGDRIGTLAWNTHRHLELWYGAAGSGAVYHTLNPRLSEDQIAYIAGHAEDAYLFCDLTFVPLAARIAARCRTLRGVAVLTDRAHMPPPAELPGALCYEELLDAADPEFAWRTVDEEDAVGLCYTSGTTGNPKGVLYSHRSSVIHALAVGGADAFGLRGTSCALPVVPMYHANAWSIPFTAPLAGAKLVLPGARLDGPSLYELIDRERVTFTAGVPSVWIGLLDYLEQEGRHLDSLERVVIGGSAVPRSMLEAFERKHGVEVVHAWGMTETSPIGSLAVPRAGMEQLEPEACMALRLKQGAPPYSVEMKIVDEAGRELPRDGRTLGRLRVRGPGIARAYFKGEGGEILDADGFFDTGDVASIDAHGFMQIADRAKDVIKSGGEWISSIELENLAMGHPGVLEAAVIGVAHPRWGERPLLIAVPRPGAALAAADLLEFLRDKLAKWQLPDEVVLVDELPHTATGKVQKSALRERFAPHRPRGT